MGEKNLVMTVHIDKLPIAFMPNTGDPISVGACPPDTIAQTIWDHDVGGEPIQRRQLAHSALALEVLASERVGL